MVLLHRFLFRQKEINILGRKKLTVLDAVLCFFDSLLLGACSCMTGREISFSSGSRVLSSFSQFSCWPALLPGACSLRSYSCSTLSHEVLQHFGAVLYCFRVSLWLYTGLRTWSNWGSKCTVTYLSCPVKPKSWLHQIHTFIIIFFSRARFGWRTKRPHIASYVKRNSLFPKGR